MQQDTEKQCQDETHYQGHGIHRAGHLPVGESDPGDQDQKGQVQVDVDACNRGNFQGPLHQEFSLKLQLVCSSAEANP